MKNRVAVVLMVSSSVALHAAAQAGNRNVATAFVDVTVVPADRERVIQHQTVVVQGGRITQMGPAAAVKVPSGATLVDGKKKFLMPGIAEMHGHLPGPDQPPEINQQWLTLFVANGVTTVRGMQGASGQPELRDRIARGETLGPRLFVYGPALDGKDITPEEGVKLVREYKKAGFDGIKIHEGLSLVTYEAIVRAAREEKLPFAGHVPNDVGLARALDAGQKSIEHFDGFVEALAGDDAAKKATGAIPERTMVSVASYVVMDKVDEKKIPELVAATRRAGAVVTPTMAIWRTLFGDFQLDELKRLPELQYFHPGMVAGWIENRTNQAAKMPPVASLRRLMSVRDKLIKALADTGSSIVLGSDAPMFFSVPGFSLRHETRAMVKAGLTPWQVLQAGTIAPARYLGREKDLGTVAVGKRADLILADDNPLVDVANIFRTSGVMVDGRWLPRAELDRMLSDIARVLRYPSDAEIKDLPVAAAEAAPLVGSYAFKKDAITVSVENGALMLTVRDEKGSTRTLRLRSQGGGVYMMPEVKAKVTFELKDGRATAFLVSQAGLQFKPTRVP